MVFLFQNAFEIKPNKNKMKITLTEDQIKMLEAWAQELPTKYGMSFIQFLAQQVQEQNPKEEAEAE